MPKHRSNGPMPLGIQSLDVRSSARLHQLLCHGNGEAVQAWTSRSIKPHSSQRHAHNLEWSCSRRQKALDIPLRWKNKEIFVNSMSDLFHEARQ